MSNSVQPHRLQPTRLLCPWDFPGKDTGGGLPFPSPEDLPNPGIKPGSPALQADSYWLSYKGSPCLTGTAAGLLSRFGRVRLCATPETAAHRPPRPWDSPGKNTGVGCHFLLQCMKVKSESEAPQSCPTLSDPMDCSLPGSSILGIFRARVLEWVAIAFSRITVKFSSILRIN